MMPKYRTIAEYRTASFSARVPEWEPIRIGKRNVNLDRLLAKHRQKIWAYMTAYSPGSVMIDRGQNMLRHDSLSWYLWARYDLVYRGQCTTHGRGWPIEPGFLVLGITRLDAMEIGCRYGQVAIVTGTKGAAANVTLCHRDLHPDAERH